MNVICFWIGLASLLVSSVLAFRFGRAQARLGATVLVSGLLLSTFTVCVLHVFGYNQAAPIVDLVSSMGMGIGLLYLALRYSSTWLAIAMMLEGAEFAVTGYFISGSPGATMGYPTYLSLLNGVDMLIVVNLLHGTFRDWRAHSVRRIPDTSTEPTLAVQ